MTTAPDELCELREESERNREALSVTVSELREHVAGAATEIKTLISPSHIKQEIRDYVRQERASLVFAVQRKVKANPLQTAAVAAAVVYPSLGLLRALPKPLWLIGAGLFLASKRGRKATHDVKSQVESVVQQGAETLTDLAGSVRSDLKHQVAGARRGAEEARVAVSGAIGGAADKARAAFHDGRDSVSGAARQGSPKAAATADLVASTFAEANDGAQRLADTTVRTSRDAVTDFVNNNALMVAGIGAVVGAIIAASIQPSEAENRLFGAGSHKLKQRAREVAAQGIETVGDIAADTAGVGAAAAAREGLNATGMQSALINVADSVRAVADRGLGTALANREQVETVATSEQSEIERTAP